jgi:type IV pilus assembly protein PilB
MGAVVAPRIQIGQMLVQAGRIDLAQLGRALAHQRERGGRLGEAVLALELVSEPVLLAELARQHAVSYGKIGEQHVPPVIVRLVPQKYIRSRRVLPIALGPAERRGTLFVATGDPWNLAVLDELAFMTGMSVRAVLVGKRDLDEAIERHLGRAGAGASV